MLTSKAGPLPFLEGEESGLALMVVGYFCAPQIPSVSCFLLSEIPSIQSNFFFSAEKINRKDTALLMELTLNIYFIKMKDCPGPEYKC